MQTATPVQAADEARVALDRPLAQSQLEEAQRLYEAATMVHERRSARSIDSAPLAHRALARALELLVRLSGAQPPADFGDLVERARAINRAEHLLVEDPGDDLAVIANMQQRFLDYTQVSTPAEDRRYDRALLRCGEVFTAVEAYLEQRLPSQTRPLRAHWKTALALFGTLLFGLLLGMQLAPRRQATASPPPAPATNSEPGAAAERGFKATFFKDKELREVAATRVDNSIAFDWASDAPPQLSQADDFSVRWEGRLRVPETGQYTFHLTSDDGSRLFVDGRLVIDNWSDHAQLTREAAVDLTEGTHDIRVEFYDNLAMALVKLEWSARGFTRRLVTRDDLE